MGKVLVVDDEVDICTLLKRQLEKGGQEVSYCLTIREALDVLARNSYDMIFVDLNLTDGSGYDLISSLGEGNRNAAVIVISAYDSEKQKALQAGATLFVPKPFTNKSISDALQQLQAHNHQP
ncbi:MAG TPA: response regulator [Cyclobacteriaceae bacterium]|nr:response regulator [Cyclobacteriaceae bacterium]